MKATYGWLFLFYCDSIACARTCIKLLKIEVTTYFYSNG